MLNVTIGHLSQFQDVKLLVEDIGVLKPTIFCAVPRVLDRIYSGAFFFLHEWAIWLKICIFLRMIIKHLHQN